MRLKNFDSVFSQPLSSGDRPNPQAAAADVDLAQEAPAPPPAAVVTCPEPAKMTANEFQQKYPNPDATITLTLGAGVNITCYVVGANAFLSSQSKVILPGVQSGETAKPLFMYAGGSWISESAKAWWSQNQQVFHSLFFGPVKIKDKYTHIFIYIYIYL